MRKQKNLSHISEGELSAMTDQLDQLHHDVAMPAMRNAVSEWVASFHEASAGVTRRASSRRTFLLGAAGVGAGGVILAACGSSSKSASPTTTAAAPGTTAAPSTTTGSSSTTSGALTGDLAVAATAASLENLAIFAYNAGLQAATAGKLGTVPPAVATFATTAKSQHTQHAAAWNAVLKAAGKKPITVTNPTLTPTIQASFAKVTDVTGLAQLALTLETAAAATYQAETSMLKSKAAIGLSASIEPVEMQHIAILYYVMGMYPGSQTSAGSPIAFSSTAAAA
jgi:hypothetical protein